MSTRMTDVFVALALCAGVCMTDRACAARGVPDSRGLVAHWTFDEGSGEVARDGTGNGHDAVLTNVEWVPSPRGHALQTAGFQTGGPRTASPRRWRLGGAADSPSVGLYSTGTIGRLVRPHPEENP